MDREKFIEKIEEIAEFHLENGCVRITKVNHPLKQCGFPDCNKTISSGTSVSIVKRFSPIDKEPWWQSICSRCYARTRPDGSVHRPKRIVPQ